MRLSHPPFFLQTLRHPSCNCCYSGEDTLLSRKLQASINPQSHLSLWSERIVYLTLVTISVFATIVVFRIVSNSIRVCGVMKLWWCWNYSSIGPTSFAGRTPNPRGKEEVATSLMVAGKYEQKAYCFVYIYGTFVLLRLWSLWFSSNSSNSFYSMLRIQSLFYLWFHQMSMRLCLDERYRSVNRILAIASASQDCQLKLNQPQS
jgi:hypothetical protein